MQTHLCISLPCTLLCQFRRSGVGGSGFAEVAQPPALGPGAGGGLGWVSAIGVAGVGLRRRGGRRRSLNALTIFE